MQRILAITAGDPAGIGYEITLKALCEPLLLEADNTTYIVYGNAETLQLAASRFLTQKQANYLSVIQKVSQASHGMINVMDVPLRLPEFDVGMHSAAAGRCAYDSIARAASDALTYGYEAIVTAPIDKRSLRLAGISEIGHTEILAGLFGVSKPLTLFITRSLRIFFYTRHLSLRQAIDALAVEPLVAMVERVVSEFAAYGFTHPRLGLAALNPHASDNGQFGLEEFEILIPAAEILRSRGIDISDPIGADSIFSQAAGGRFDAVISLYHDQGHIAAKTYDFHRTISATLGLPLLRTSVDHGTAMDIAWRGTADALSMRTAIEKALTRLV